MQRSASETVGASLRQAAEWASRARLFQFRFSLPIKGEGVKHQPRICQYPVHCTLTNLQPLTHTVISI